MMGKIESGWIREALSRWIPGAAAMQFWYFFPGFDMSKMTWINVVPAGGAALGWVAQWTAKRFSRWAANLLVDNPLHAEVSALHYYFTHINPYLDYAFSYGQTHFIMMDSGSDVFIGNLLDGKEVRDLKRASFTDNFIGASPDSRAFDSERTHNNWSQIVWLEKVLDATSIGDRDTVFVSLHAPPLNAPNQLYRELGWWERLVYQFNRRFRGRFRIYPRIESWAETRESHPLRKTQHPWIAKEEIDLSFGTVNHYLSQFFYLCLGLRESEHRRGPSVGTHTKVSMVLAGHAHRNIEFSIGLDYDTHKHENQVRVFSDVYSQPPTHLGQEWKSRPLVVQTAACGPTGRNDTGPPYYRRIEVSNSQIQDFRVFDKNGPDDWFQRGSQSC